MAGLCLSLSLIEEQTIFFVFAAVIIGRQVVLAFHFIILFDNEFVYVLSFNFFVLFLCNHEK